MDTKKKRSYKQEHFGPLGSGALTACDLHKKD